MQQFCFARRQFHFAVKDLYLISRHIDHQTRDTNLVLRFRMAPLLHTAQYGLGSREHFPRVERLGHIVIRACFQTQNTVVVFFAGSQQAVGELLLLYALVGGLAFVLERRAGQVAPQGWEFYAVTAALFVTFAFPGFVYRYLLRHRH